MYQSTRSSSPNFRLQTSTNLCLKQKSTEVDILNPGDQSYTTTFSRLFFPVFFFAPEDTGIQ